MVFSGLSFLYFFLPVSLLLYAITPPRAKNAALLALSLAFYFYGEPRYTPLILAMALSAYLHGLWIAHAETKRGKKRALLSALVIALGALGIFKYADLAVRSVNAVFSASLPLPGLALPIGISFYTFQAASYVVDVYRGDVAPQKSPVRFCMYITFFPQLIAGPIVRYAEVEQSLAARAVRAEDVARGLRRFTLGLGKKVLLANVLGQLVSECAAAPARTVLCAWLAAVGYMLQIYFDFSGYSDMAVGLGRMFGFHFPENFRYPYTAVSVTDFWRRWHITLSQWFRDYAYIPLGGNRVGKARWLLNLTVVWGLTGLWHGASWTFLAWGLYFAALLICEKLFLLRTLGRLPACAGRFYTLLAVLFGFVLFRAESFAAARAQLFALFGVGVNAFSDAHSLYLLASYAFTLLLAALCATPLLARLFARLANTRPGGRALVALEAPALGVLLLLCTAYLVDGSFNPFLYFRF